MSDLFKGKIVTNLNVLMIKDDAPGGEKFVDVVVDRLETVGVQVTSVETNTQFMFALQSDQFDCLLLNLGPLSSGDGVARMQEGLRRVQNVIGTRHADVLKMGAVTLDRLRHTATREDGSEINFTPAEFTLVWVLAQADGKVMSRDVLIEAVSNGTAPINFRAVDILISRVRKKLGDKSAVRTVPHCGYKCGWVVTRA